MLPRRLLGQVLQPGIEGGVDAQAALVYDLRAVLGLQQLPHVHDEVGGVQGVAGRRELQFLEPGGVGLFRRDVALLDH